MPASRVERPTNLTVNGKKDGIRYRRRFALDPEEKGIDLTKPLYVTVYGEWTKKAGIGRIDPGKPGVDDAAAGTTPRSACCTKAQEGRRLRLHPRDEPRSAPTTTSPTRRSRSGKKVTDANPQQDEVRLVERRSKLVEYKGINGKKLQAALFLPANYEPGKKYPTIVYIYEKLSQGTAPVHAAATAGGFNVDLHVATATRC